MSNTPASEETRSPSLISNLRHFRFQKKPIPKINSIDSPPEGNNSTVGLSSPVSPVSPLTKPTTFNKPNRIVYTDSEEEAKSPNKLPVTEVALKALRDYFPNIDQALIQRSLIKCRGDVAAAKVAIKEEFYGFRPASVSYSTITPAKRTLEEKSENVTNVKANLLDSSNKLFSETKPEINVNSKSTYVGPPVKRTFSETINHVNQGNSSNKRIKKDKKKLDDYDESGDSDDNDGYNKQDRRVFDSDEDSDVEISDDMNLDQRQVYDFLSTAAMGELLCMPNCSKKKAEAIIEQRPFTGWKNMVEKFQEGKNLGTEILNSAQEVLYTRHVVNQLMQKCSRLAVEMERAVALGASRITTQPESLTPSLKLAGYQMVGLNWLLVLHNRGLNGILADEMGLGKTVQVISFLAHLQETSVDDVDHVNRGPHLIVVPASTMDNWGLELSRWCPSLKVIVYYGNLDERKMMRIQFSQQGVNDYDVVLTTYSMITSTPEERKMFRVLPFNYVVFDEAHMLKNMNTQRFENLMRVNAKHRILMTGTPLQNNLLELMSLLTFVMPEMFAKKKDYLKCLFTRNTKTIKTNENEKEVTPRFEQEQVAQAKRIMKPFVLRRLKKDVLKDLPEKKEELIYCSMAERQRVKYAEMIATFSKKAERKEMREAVDEVSGLSMMMDLRKYSNHPLLLRDIYDSDQLAEMAVILAEEKEYKETNIDYIKEDLSVLSDFQLHTLARSFTSLTDYRLEDKDIVKSGKFEKLDELLPNLQQENHRVLIFSQFVIMLDVMEEYLRIRGYKYLRLDGSTQVTIRQDLIDAFNQDPSIFIFMLSTRAGGLGINLTAADTVIIHDIDFNPYNDKQAEDRCHRVGQTKPVRVIRFISKDSIEESIYQVALEKLSLEKELSSEENEHSETTSVVRLLKKALGVEVVKSSPIKKPT